MLLVNLETRKLIKVTYKDIHIQPLTAIWDIYQLIDTTIEKKILTLNELNPKAIYPLMTQYHDNSGIFTLADAFLHINKPCRYPFNWLGSNSTKNLFKQIEISRLYGEDVTDEIETLKTKVLPHSAYREMLRDFKKYEGSVPFSCTYGSNLFKREFNNLLKYPRTFLDSDLEDLI